MFYPELRVATDPHLTNKLFLVLTKNGKKYYSSNEESTYTDNNGSVKVSHYRLDLYSHVNVAIVTIPDKVAYC